MDKKELAFSVFCIENAAERLGIDGGKMYRLLSEESDILDSYIIPCYDTLHTQGKDYVVNDIIDCMGRKNILP